MRKGRLKSKKPAVVSSREDTASGDDEKVPESKRRGRPQKQSKDGIDEDGVAKKEEGEDVKGSVSIMEMKSQAAMENGRKRKRSTQAKDNMDLVKKEHCITTKSSIDDSSKSVGYRQNGSRRKNKPRRAAEAVVECK